MTWVLAQPTAFGQIIFLSDIQVTFEDQKTKTKTYRDCLQKIYLMDENIVAAFAGNVIGGFCMLSSLSKHLRELHLDSPLPIEPENLTALWSIKAKQFYSQLRPEAKHGGIHLIIGGVSHSQDNGLPGAGKTHLVTLRSPDFTPEATLTGQWASIGSGSHVEDYKKVLESYTADPYHPLMQMEVQNDGGYANTLSILVSYEAQKMKAIPGISQHFHRVVISRQGVQAGTSDHREYLGEPNEYEIKMPAVARSLDDFLKILPSFQHEVTALA